MTLASKISFDAFFAFSKLNGLRLPPAVVAIDVKLQKEKVDDEGKQQRGSRPSVALRLGEALTIVQPGNGHLARLMVNCKAR